MRKKIPAIDGHLLRQSSATARSIRFDFEHLSQVQKAAEIMCVCSASGEYGGYVNTHTATTVDNIENNDNGKARYIIKA